LIQAASFWQIQLITILLLQKAAELSKVATLERVATEEGGVLLSGLMSVNLKVALQ